MEAPLLDVPEPNGVRRILSQVGFMMMVASAAHTVRDSTDPSVSKVHIFAVYTLGLLGLGLLLLSMGRLRAPAEAAASELVFLSRVGFMMMVASVPHTVRESNDPSVSKVHIFAVYTLGVLGLGLLLLSMGRLRALAEAAAAPKAVLLSRVGFMMMVASAARTVRFLNDPSVSKVHLFAVYTLGVLGSWLLLLSVRRPQAPAEAAAP